MIRTRQAAIRDNELLAEIGAETFYDSFAADNTPEDMTAYLSASFNSAKQGIELADPQSRFLIAEINDEIVGYTHLRFSVVPQMIVGQKPMEIARFYARKPWLGKGVGAHLMKGCLQEARAEGCDVIWLDVWERNLRAIAFYRSWGFIEIGKQTFQLGNDLQQDLLMARSLYIIRQYKDSDLDDVMSSWENASKITHPFLKEDFQAQVRKDIPELYLPNADTWVVEADNQVAGFIALIGNEIGAIFLQPEHQGKKMGKLMMDKAQELHGDLEVEVFEKNSIGRNFYSQYGFKLIEEKIHEPTGERVLRLKFSATRQKHSDAASSADV